MISPMPIARRTGRALLAGLGLCGSASAKEDARGNDAVADDPVPWASTRRGPHLAALGRVGILGDALTASLDAPTIGLHGGALRFDYPVTARGGFRFGTEFEFVGLGEGTLAGGDEFDGATVSGSFVSLALVPTFVLAELGPTDLQLTTLVGVVSTGTGGDLFKATGPSESLPNAHFSAESSYRFGIGMTCLYWFSAEFGAIGSIALDGRDMVVKAFESDGTVQHRREILYGEFAVQVGLTIGAGR